MVKINDIVNGTDSVSSSLKKQLDRDMSSYRNRELENKNVKEVSPSVNGKSSNPGKFIFLNNKSGNPAEGNTPGKPSDYESNSNSEDGSFTPTSMFEYMMGIKNIKIQHDTYKEREAYVTKPIEVIGNVMEIQLQTIENHPVFDTISGKAAKRQTSIEYSMTYKENPDINDWLPILPENEKEVVGERLFFNGTQAELRFPSNISSLVVYQNNLKIDDSYYKVISNQAIEIPLVESNAIYTVDYKPNVEVKNPWTIDMQDYKYDVKKVKEVFEEGTAFNKTIELKYYPYVNYEKINSVEEYNPNTDNYSPVKVKLINASIVGKGNKRLKVIEPYKPELEAYTYNKSLYKDKSWSELNKYNLDSTNYYGGFDYYQWKNKLVFTESFNAAQLPENRDDTHGIAQIEVEYEYLVGNFRMKAIMRRNTSEEVTATPQLLNYTLKFKTMK